MTDGNGDGAGGAGVTVNSFHMRPLGITVKTDVVETVARVEWQDKFGQLQAADFSGVQAAAVIELWAHVRESRHALKHLIDPAPPYIPQLEDEGVQLVLFSGVGIE